MLKDISTTVISMKPSPIREMFNVASKMENVVSFVLGEPDFDTPENISQASMDALNKGQTHYTHNAGILELREAIADKLKKENNIIADPNTEILVAAGATEVLSMVFRILLEEGDEIIIQDPIWSTCLTQVEMYKGKVVPVPLDEKDNFRLNPEAVRKVVTKKTKAILINTPQNPTGAVIPKEQLIELAKIAQENNLYIIADEVYQKILYGENKHFSIASLDEFKERTITIDSFSKTYAMTGWRVGYAVANKNIISKMTQLHEFYSSCVNTPAQYGAIEALTSPASQEALDKMLAEYRVRREAVIEQINSIEGLEISPPDGAFYAFINVKKFGLTSADFAMRLLKEQKVTVAPGSGFGANGEGYIRISYATSVENIIEGCNRIKKFVESL